MAGFPHVTVSLSSAHGAARLIGRKIVTSHALRQSQCVKSGLALRPGVHAKRSCRKCRMDLGARLAGWLSRVSIRPAASLAKSWRLAGFGLWPFRTSNIERRTPNFERGLFRIRRSMFDVRRSPLQSLQWRIRRGSHSFRI